VTTPKFPAAPHAPEQVIVLGGTGSQDVPGRGDHLDGDEVVAGEATLASQAAHPAAEREPAHTGMSDDARRGGQSEGLRLPVEITQECSTFGARRSLGRLDPDAPHPG
jgi:hypothetical protein